MKLTVKRPVEIEVKYVIVSLHVRNGDECMANDFPLREGDLWTVSIDIDTGKINNWPMQDGPRAVDLKVCDEGCYTLCNAEWDEVAVIDNDYVPHGLIPGDYGDYVSLSIAADGTITNWPREPDLSAFFATDED